MQLVSILVKLRREINLSNNKIFFIYRGREYRVIRVGNNFLKYKAVRGGAEDTLYTGTNITVHGVTSGSPTIGRRLILETV